MTDFREIRAAQREAGERVVLDGLAAKKAARRGPFAPTATGMEIDLLAPDPDTVSLRDIAAGLAKQCRWNGAPRSFYSVAQHSVHVADILPMDDGSGAAPGLLKIYGLLHDAHEIATGDITAPMKRAIGISGGAGILATLERGIDHAIHTAFHLSANLPEEWRRQIKLADRIALATEKRDLMPDRPIWSGDLPPAAPKAIKPLNWDRAEDLFLTRARELAAIAWLSGGAWDR